MAALSAARLTKSRLTKESRTNSYTVAASTQIWAGGLVAIDANGDIIPATLAANAITVVGRALESVDNTSGSAGDLSCDVEANIVLAYANSAGADEITAVEIGKICFIVDDQTLAKTDGGATRRAAGYVRQVDSDGVWIEVTGNFIAVS